MSPPAVNRLPVIGDNTPNNGKKEFRTTGKLRPEQVSIPGVTIPVEIIMFTQVTLTGTAPMLLHRFDAACLAPKQTNVTQQKPTEMEAALNGLYPDPDGKKRIVLPRDNIKAMLREAGKFVPIKGRLMVTKADGKSRLSFMMRIPEPFYVLKLGERELTVADMKPDVRSAKNQTEQKIISVRPRIEDWQLSFEMLWKTSECNEALLFNLVRMAGLKVGAGTYGPNHNGEFGTFVATHWQTRKLSDAEAMAMEF